MFGGIANFIGSDEELYGRRPKVPDSPNFGAIAGEQIQANIKNLPSLRELASLSTDAINAMLEQSLPGYKTLRDTGTNLLTSWARGEVSPEADADIQRRAAEMGIALGTTGSKFNEHRQLKTTLDYKTGLQERALAAAPSWIAQARNNTFDFSKMFIFDPFREGEFRWQRDWLASQVAAAPDPSKRGALETELAVLGISAGVMGGNAYGGSGYSPQASYGQGMSGGGGYNSGSFFGTGNNGMGASEGGGDIGGGEHTADWFSGGGFY